MKKEKIIIRIIVAVFGLFTATSIIPALLSADNDLAVTLGVTIIAGIIAYGFLFWKEIINWFKNIN